MATKRAEISEKEAKIVDLEEKLLNLVNVNQTRTEEIAQLTEGMRELNASYGRQFGPNWMLLYGNGGNDYDADGLELDTIKSISDDLRSHIVAGALMKRLSEVRGDYIYGDGIKFKQVPTTFRTSVLEDPKNQDCLFSVKALKELNAAHCSDGNIVMGVNTKNKRLFRIPIFEITAHYANPEDNEDIWAVRRAWATTTPGDTNAKPMERWYKTDMAPAGFTKATLRGQFNDNVAIDRDSIVVIDKVNSQVGWTWGVPDLLASLQWAERYGTYLKFQHKFAQSLSMIAVQYKAATEKGQATAKSIVRNPGAAGNSVTGSDFDIVAQKGASDVSFDNGRPMASAAASAAGISVVTALADPGATGAAYGAATALDDPTTRMVQARRQSFELFLRRILRLLGQKKVTIVWPKLSDDPLYRQTQSVLGALGSGLFEGDELRDHLAAMLDIDLTAKSVPDGYLLPNNSHSWQLSSIDPAATMQASIKNGEPVPSQATDGSNSQANGQGRDSLGIGNTLGDSNDLRDMDKK